MMLAYILRSDVLVLRIARCLVLRWHVRMFLWRKAEVVFSLCVVLLM